MLLWILLLKVWAGRELAVPWDCWLICLFDALGSVLGAAAIERWVVSQI